MLQSIKFCKMHGLGNDFMVIDAINQKLDSKKIPISRLAHRHLGIGFDQLLLVEKAAQADFACRIFNADGSEAEQCGNGMRCIARFIHEQRFSPKKTLAIETAAGVIKAVIDDYNTIQITMNIPDFVPAHIPFLAANMAPLYEIEIDPAIPVVSFAVLSIGNPHAILRVPSVLKAPVTQLGEKIALHPLFPKGTNVGFMEIVNPQQIRLRTFERGVGETLACGSNACAAVAAGIMNSWLSPKVNVELAYGNLLVEWEGENFPVIISGPAVQVYQGIVNLN